jgi:hypothetical protein
MLQRLLDGPLGRSALVRAAWAAWLRFRNESLGNRPTEVEPGCWIGAVPTRGRWRSLQAAGVTHVVTLVGETPPPRWLGSAHGLLWLPVPDRAGPTRAQLRAGVEFLAAARAAGHGVLVCCGSGAGRSPTLYAAWLLERGRGGGDATLADALDMLRRRRPLVAPTPRQLAVLAAWAAESAPRPA